MSLFELSSSQTVLSFRHDLVQPTSLQFGPLFAVREFDTKVIRGERKGRLVRGGPSEQAIRASIRQGKEITDQFT